MESIRIEILNWDKFNPRKDIKRPHWFALDNRVLEKPEFFGFNSEEKLSWIYLLCSASQANSPIAEIYIDHAKGAVGIPEKSLLSAIDKLCKRGCLRLVEARTDPNAIDVQIRTDPIGSVQTRTSTEHYITLQNKGDRESDDSPPPLPQIWNEHCGPYLAQTQKISASRKRKAKLRLAEHTEAEWVEVVKRVAASRFCNGDNDRGWRATFDWLLQPDTALKVLEGKYDNREHKPKTGDPWEVAARRVLDGIRAHPPGKTEELKAHLGDDLFATALRVPGGISAIRKLPSNDFTTKTLSQMLAGAAT